MMLPFLSKLKRHPISSVTSFVVTVNAPTIIEDKRCRADVIIYSHLNTSLSKL